MWGIRKRNFRNITHIDILFRFWLKFSYLLIQLSLYFDFLLPCCANVSETEFISRSCFTSATGKIDDRSEFDELTKSARHSIWAAMKMFSLKAGIIRVYFGLNRQLFYLFQSVFFIVTIT